MVCTFNKLYYELRMVISKSFVDKIFKLGAYFVVILVLLDILVYFFYPNSKFREIFLATREQTPLTWVSVVLLFLIGLSCALIYDQTRNRLWYFLSLVYFFFSMDDATYFHERFSSAVQSLIPYLSNYPSYSWFVMYLPLLIFGLGGLLYMLWEDSTSSEKKILFVIFFLLGFALFLDILDGYVVKHADVVFCLNPICNATVTHLFRLTEETLEVFGFGLLAYVSLIEHHKKKYVTLNQ